VGQALLLGQDLQREQRRNIEAMLSSLSTVGRTDVDFGSVSDVSSLSVRLVARLNETLFETERKFPRGDTASCEKPTKECDTVLRNFVFAPRRAR
jgi:hypothetical protein